MKLIGGDWSKGDVVAVLGLVLTLAGLVVTLATPELRKAVGLESSQTEVPPSNETILSRSVTASHKPSVAPPAPRLTEGSEHTTASQKSGPAYGVESSADRASMQPVQTTYQKVFSDGFLFELQYCVLRTKTLTCDFAITNTGDADRRMALMIYWGEDSSRVFDESGNEYISQRGQIGNNSGTPGISGLWNTLLPDVKTKASLEFEPVRPEASIAKLLRVTFHASPNPVLSVSHADFSDVSLQKR
jgi:hypothetical protein